MSVGVALPRGDLLGNSQAKDRWIDSGKKKNLCEEAVRETSRDRSGQWLSSWGERVEREGRGSESQSQEWGLGGGGKGRESLRVGRGLWVSFELSSIGLLG